MKIKNYISKDLVIGAIGGSILATIITSIIDAKTVNKAKEELDISDEEYKKLAENMDDQDEVIKAQGLKIQELEDELEKYKTKEVLEDRERIKKEEAKKAKESLEAKKEKESLEVKKAIEKKDWTTVYNKAEGWYNKYPVQMGRYEVFRYLRQDGYITDEEVDEARNYYGSLWDYVGD